MARCAVEDKSSMMGLRGQMDVGDNEIVPVVLYASLQKRELARPWVHITSDRMEMGTNRGISEVLWKVQTKFHGRLRFSKRLRRDIYSHRAKICTVAKS